MKTIQRTFIHPSDGLEMTYDVKVYAPKGTLLISTIRGDLGVKNATGSNRVYAIELHDARTWQKLIEDGITTTCAYTQRWPNSNWLGGSRKVKTPRIPENFISANYIEQDDDSQLPTTLDFWRQDVFFKNYGYALVESSNSTHSSQRCHPFVVFDKTITDKDYYELLLKAWIFYYTNHAKVIADNMDIDMDIETVWGKHFPNRADRALGSVNEIYYHKQGSKTIIIGNICPLSVYETEILTPYRQHLKYVAEQKAIKQSKRLARAKATNQPQLRSNHANPYVVKTFKRIIDDITSTPVGSRHQNILTKSTHAGALTLADWHTVDTTDWWDYILSACRSNGYIGKYGEDSALRILNLWDTLDPAEEPIWALGIGDMVVATHPDGHIITKGVISQVFKDQVWMAKIGRITVPQSWLNSKGL